MEVIGVAEYRLEAARSWTTLPADSDTGLLVQVMTSKLWRLVQSFTVKNEIDVCQWSGMELIGDEGRDWYCCAQYRRRVQRSHAILYVVKPAVLGLRAPLSTSSSSVCFYLHKLDLMFAMLITIQRTYDLG